MTDVFENRLADLFGEPDELPDDMLFAAQVETRLAADFRRAAFVIGLLCALGVLLTYPLIGRMSEIAADGTAALLDYLNADAMGPAIRLSGLGLLALVAAGLGGYQSMRR